MCVRACWLYSSSTHKGFFCRHLLKRKKDLPKKRKRGACVLASKHRQTIQAILHPIPFVQRVWRRPFLSLRRYVGHRRSESDSFAPSRGGAGLCPYRADLRFTFSFQRRARLNKKRTRLARSYPSRIFFQLSTSRLAPKPKFPDTARDCWFDLSWVPRSHYYFHLRSILGCVPVRTHTQKKKRRARGGHKHGKRSRAANSNGSHLGHAPAVPLKEASNTKTGEASQFVASDPKPVNHVKPGCAVPGCPLQRLPPYSTQFILEILGRFRRGFVGLDPLVGSSLKQDESRPRFPFFDSIAPDPI